MNLTRTVAPARLPVSLDEVKDHARIDYDDTAQDAALTGYIRAAVEWLDGKDGYLGRALITQTWRLILDAFPTGECIEIPLPNLISVGSIIYNVDSSPTIETFAASNYIVDTGSIPGRIALADGSFWPQTNNDINAVTITFTSGFGAMQSDVPERLRLAISMLAGHWYEYRIPVLAGATVTDVPFHIRALVDNYRMMSF